jgi:lipopolysaccharide biosynthesis regulator YciM
MMQSKQNAWRGAAALLVACAGVLHAQVAGEIETTQGRTIKGTIRWQPASKVYGIVQANNIELKVPAQDVQSVRVTPPQHLEAAAKLVAEGQVDQALPVLQQIFDAYRMLQWDVIAARWLAEGHLKNGDAKRAVEMCEAVIEQNPAAGYSGDIPRVYWRALLELDRTAKLKQALTESIKRGDRETMALAQVIRGDLAMQEGEFEAALVDGYLRTVYLFREVKQVQPEALYKAAQCFKKLNQLTHMETMRKKLLENYPNDPYTQKIKAGA